MVAIGAISYSLYLCHWPIIFFGRFIFGDAAANSLAGILTMLAAMVAVATAMYALIERRFVQPSGFRSASFLKNAAGFCAVILTLAAIAHVTFLSKGFAWRLPNTQADLAHLQDFPTGRDMQSIEGPVGFELVGDSLSGQYAVGLSPLMKQLNINFDVSGGAGCPILYGVTLKAVRREECLFLRDHALDRMGKTNLPIIYAQKWSLYDDAAINDEFGAAQSLPPSKGSFAKLQPALERTMEKLVAAGHRILLIGEQPDPGCPINRPRLLQGPLPHAPQPCPSTAREVVQQATGQIDRMLARIQAQWPDRIELLRPVDYFCDTECPVVKDGIWLYSSRIHLTLAGSNYMVTRTAEVFRQFLAPH
jgi:hypothetical protein